MTDKKPPITRKEALARAAECREMGRASKFEELRIMLQHMAETWQRIADSLETEH